MKRLIVFRHAKSDWSAEYSSDRERPLAPRGQRAARDMGRLLPGLGLTPDLVLSSPAVRALHTAELAAEAGNWGCPVVVADELYSGSVGSLLALARRQESSLETIVLASHEPTCSDLVSELIGGGDFKIPTAAMARIDLPVTTWAELDEGTGVLAWLVPPKLLKRADGE